MAVFSLPGLVVEGLVGVQVLLNLGDFLFYIILIFFARFLCIINFRENRFLLLFLSLFLGFLGFGIFIWEMSALSSARFLLREYLPGPPFIIYRSTAPPLALVVTGPSGLIVFLSGAVIFLTRAGGVKNPSLRQRSLLIGLAGFMGGLSDTLNFTFAALNIVVFHFFESLVALIAVLLVYRAALIGAREARG